jgi:tRNA dimethylallyltransferase
VSDADRLSSILAGTSDDTLLTIVGPTASGKTSLAIALAEATGGEIISADSVQIYQGFDIGSGKPTPEERAAAPHHLIDLLDPMAAVDAARFTELADEAIASVRARGKRPILCGGSFLWVKALLRGLADAPPADAAIRARHREDVVRDGRKSLHDRLRAVDPISAARLHENDVLRVSRALEVFELTGRTLSEGHAGHGFQPVRHKAKLLVIPRTPDELTLRIAARVEAWLAAGWIEETEALLARGFGDARAMTSVGYREVREHLLGNLTRDELGMTIVRATRVFARRQRTWLNHEPHELVVWP